MTNDYHDKKTMALGLMSTMRLMGLMALMGLIVLMGLMSCSSSDDAVDNNPPAPVLTEVAISFSGSESQEDAVTRAAGKPLHDAGPTQFTVWGYKDMRFVADVYGDMQTVFPGYAVDWHEGSAATTTTNSNGWEYIKADPEQTIKYWDFSAKAYRFFGVTGTPSGADGTYGGVGTYWTSGSYKTYELTLSADASGVDKDEIATNIAATPYFSRLWFSTGDPVAYPNKKFGKPVTLEFLKPLTRVRYIFKYAYPREGIKLTDASFKPTADVDEEDDSKKVKIARKGTVTVHYPKDGTETKEWYTTEVDADKSTRLTDLTVDYDPEDDSKDYVTLSSGLMTSDGWYVLLPNISQGSYTLSVSVNGEDKTAVVPQQYMQWLPGYSYTYIFKITDEGGVEIGWVEYAVTPWTELEADRTVYNW